MSTRYKVYAFTDDNLERPVIVYEEELADSVFNSASLNALNNVNITAVQDGQTLSWNSSTEQWENVTPSSGSGGSIPVSDAIFVDPNLGNDATGDGTNGSPYQTLQAGIDAAVAGQSVICSGGGDFAENVVGKTDVDVIAPYSDLILNDGNQLRFAAGRYVFRRLIRTSGTGPMIISDNQTSYAIVTVYEINDTGTGDTLLGNNNAPTDLKFSQAYIGNGASFIRTDSSGQHIHVAGEDIYLTAPNTTAIEINGGATILLDVHHLKELDSGVGSGTGFNVVNGDINADINEGILNTFAIIEADGRLNVSAQEAGGAITNNGGVYTYKYNEFAGSTRIGSDLGIRLVASSYIFEGLSGNDGAFLTVGANGALVPATLNEGSTVWEDTTPAFTDIDSTVEETVFELTVDSNFDSGSVQFDISIEYPYFRNHTVRLYRNATLLDEQTFTGSTTPLNFSGALAITSAVTSGDTFSLTLQTDVAPGFEPNRGDIQSGGFLRVTKSGQGFGGIGLYQLITDADSPFTTEAGEQLIVDTNGGAVTVVAPASGNFSVSDVGGNASVNNITIDFSAKNLLLNGATQSTFIHDLNNEKLLFIDDGTNYRRIS